MSAKALGLAFFGEEEELQPILEVQVLPGRSQDVTRPTTTPLTAPTTITTLNQIR